MPVAERVDGALTAVVEDMLVEWARGCGFEVGDLGHLRYAGFGRLAVLTHVDPDDPDRLLIAAKLIAAWRRTGEYPPAWKYLATRRHDSFYTPMALIDAIGGYEVPANLYYEPNVRRATMLAGTASVVVNDLLSVAKDAADEKPVCDMVLQVAADRGCPVEEAVEAVVDLRNGLVRDCEELHRGLLPLPSPELQRFLRGLRSWMGGGFEWHNTNPRYRT